MHSEQIYIGDMFGTDANYIETEIAYNAGYLRSEGLGGRVLIQPPRVLAFGFVTDGVNGCLFR